MNNILHSCTAVVSWDLTKLNFFLFNYVWELVKTWIFYRFIFENCGISVY